MTGVRGSPVERFWPKVDRRGPDDCWPWLASLDSDGYGQLRVGSMVKAHRFSYELLVGPIPDGLTLDHVCRNRACVNPAHLEPVTLGENVLRGGGPSAENARKTHCLRGHELVGRDLGRRPDGSRYCLRCQRARLAALRRRRPRLVA